MLWRHRCSLLIYYQAIGVMSVVFCWGALIGCGAPSNSLKSQNGDIAQGVHRGQDSYPANAWTLDLQPTFLADDYKIQLIEPCVVWLIDPTNLEEVQVYLDNNYYLPTSSWQLELLPACGDITLSDKETESVSDDDQAAKDSSDIQDTTSEDQDIAEGTVIGKDPRAAEKDPRAVDKDPRNGENRYD